MDLIAEVAAAEEIQLAQIQAHAAAAAVGVRREPRPGHSTMPMGVAVGSELSTEVRVFVFAWADPAV